MRPKDAPPPGWYPDPLGGSRLRWWEGRDWADRFRPPPVTTVSDIIVSSVEDDDLDPFPTSYTASRHDPPPRAQSEQWSAQPPVETAYESNHPQITIGIDGQERPAGFGGATEGFSIDQIVRNLRRIIIAIVIAVFGLPLIPRLIDAVFSLLK